MLPQIKSIVEGQLLDIRQTIKATVEEALKGLSDTLQKHTEEINELRCENLKLQKQNSELDRRISQIEMDNDAAEQYSRRNCLRIRGIPESVSEDTDTVVLDVAKKLNVTMALEEIDRSHRVGAPTKRNRDIIVKFATYRTRQRLYSQRKALRDMERMGNVFVNEDLTRKRSEILFYARRFVKGKKLKSAYSSDGKIFVYDNGDNRHLIKTESDLNAFGDVEELKERLKAEKAGRREQIIMSGEPEAD